MTTKPALIVCLALISVALTGLPAVAQDQQPDFGQMFQALLGGAAQGEQAEAAEPINFRELKELLPKELPGMKRVEASGEKSGAMGMTVSTAKAVYKGEDSGQITIEFSDIGGTGSFAALAQMGFQSAEIDRETEHGYERTTKFDGHPGKEQYDSKTRRGEISAYVGKRVTAKADGYKVTDEALHEAFKAIDLKKLAALAAKATEAAAESAEEDAEEDAEEKTDK